MKTPITTLSLFYTAFIFGQSDTNVIQTYYPNQSVYEEYQVSLPDSNKNGYFKRFTKTGKIYVSGQYKNNERIGIWVWFPNTEARYRDTVEIYNYDTRKEVFFKDTANKMPRYPGGYDEFGIDLGKSLKFPIELLQKYDGKTIFAQYKLSCNGKISDIKFSPKSHFRDKTVEDFLITALTKEYYLWIPCKDGSWDSNAIGFIMPITLRMK